MCEVSLFVALLQIQVIVIFLCLLHLLPVFHALDFMMLPNVWSSFVMFFLSDRFLLHTEDRIQAVKRVILFQFRTHRDLRNRDRG